MNREPIGTNAPTPFPSLAAIVLAGGKSSRMGQDKALLTFKGQPLLSHITRTASLVTPQVAVVTSWPNKYRRHLPDDVTLIQEPSAHGPLSGFLTGWHGIRAEWCLVLACDLPHLKAPALTSWWQWLHLTTHPALCQPMASLTPGQKGWEPLCGFYHRSCISHLQQYLSAIPFQQHLPPPLPLPLPLQCSHPRQPSLPATSQVDLSIPAQARLNKVKIEPQKPQTFKPRQSAPHAPRRSPGFQKWLATLTIKPYWGISRHMLFNCNTPQDWQQVASKTSRQG